MKSVNLTSDLKQYVLCDCIASLERGSESVGSSVLPARIGQLEGPVGSLYQKVRSIEGVEVLLPLLSIAENYKNGLQLGISVWKDQTGKCWRIYI